MAQTAEAQAFLRRLGELPDTSGVDLGPAITPSLQDEADLRRLFATDRDNVRLKDPYVGLVDVFGQNTDRIKKIHARTIKDDDDLLKHHIMPLDTDTRRKDGELSMASSLDDFKLRWSIFSEGTLSQLTNWNNVVVAGGSVLACLAPLPEHVVKQGSKRAIRKYYHSEAYPASDVDVFLYGLTPEQAEEKCVEIYNAVQDSVPWEVCAVRTKNAVSIHCQYPYRPVQIVLRIYQSPAEILAGFDVDSACVAFDGSRVLAAPRAILALMTQCNRVAMDRRSPSYEVRLAKYAARGFEIYVPDLRRKDFDPTIFERALTRVSGLARLLVLEKLSTQEARDAYISQRRHIRARPNASGGPKYRRASRRARRRQRGLEGDLKAAAEFGGLQMSEYDVMFHIPYGPGIDAKRISKIVYETDFSTNSTLDPKNRERKFHRHPAFFGNMKEALGDCCKYCPLPETDEEKETFEKQQEQFITGRVSFMQDDPGRQSITGSFRPIDSGEWSEEAYLKPLAELYSYIAAHNRPACNEFLKRNAQAINTRDHLGRTPLQFALLCSAGDICLDLIEQGSRMIARLVDGRCSLHLAAQMGLPNVVKALLEKSEKNKAEKEAKEKEAKEKEGKDKDVKMKDRDDEIRDSSEDDWSSENDEDKDYEEAKKKVDPKGDPVESEDDPLEDSEDRPDILDIDAPDWDQCLTALGYAIIGGSLLSLQILVAAGADCKTPRSLNASYQSSSTFYPLDLTALTPDESIGAQMAEHLITIGGASCAAADSSTVTVFHRLVSLNKPQIVEMILKVDPTAKAASRFLYASSWQSTIHPIVSAFASGQRAMVAVLLAYADTRAFIDLETYDRSIAANPNQSAHGYARVGEECWKTSTLQPLEASLADYNDLYRLVLALEPESVKNFIPRGVQQNQTGPPGFRRSMLDFLRSALREVKRRSRQQPAPLQPAPFQPNIYPTHNPALSLRSIFDLSDVEISEQTGWDAYAIGLEKRNRPRATPDVGFESRSMGFEPNVRPYAYHGFPFNPAGTEDEQRARATKLIPYFEQAIEELEKAGAQTWDAIYSDMPSEWMMQYGHLDHDPDDPNPPPPPPTANEPLNPFSRFPPSFGLFGQVPGPGISPPPPIANQPLNPFPRFPMGTGLPSFGIFGQVLGPVAPPPIDEKMKPFKKYSLFTSGFGEGSPGTHLIPLYNELYEACWTGDNDKIRALCLPPEDDALPPQSGTRDLLQITAKVQYVGQNHGYTNGYSPLYVALRARKWDTARLILEIAQKQFMKEEDDEQPKQVRPSGNIITFNDRDDDDEDSDTDSCASDQTETRPIGYTNLAKRFHTVSVKVKPNQLFVSDGTNWATGSISGFRAFPGATSADPMTLAILENDVEAFNQIADMMEGLEEPMAIPVHLQQTIMATDSPEILDAFIRRTGEGLSLPKPKVRESTDDAAQVQPHDGYKHYLGLDVDGKKRKDLVPREDPGTSTGHQIPIAWQAASKQATAILEYLNSPKAIEAYKYYAGTKKTGLAKRLAEVLQYTDDFPQMEGFSVSPLAETPVLAAIWNPTKPDRILPTLRKLMELQPRLTADGVRLQVKPGGMSPLLFLCNTKAPLEEVFDWMLANGADPLVRDERGWNILHLLFSSYDNNWTLTEHVLTKLPADVTQALMAQQSCTQRNTPFAVAVKQANVRLVELLLRTVKDAVLPTLLLRDCTGATPLHSAILQGSLSLVELLLRNAKDAVVPALLLRDRTGATPLHSAILQRSLSLVELLVRNAKDAVVPALLLRDRTGATPLHSAILQGLSKIVSHLISIGPPEMLYMENGVGTTPMEITRLQFLTQTLRGLVSPLVQPDGFNIHGTNVLQLTPAPGMRDRDEKEVQSLRRVIVGIKSSGALATKPELLKVLSDFADRSEQEFAAWVAEKPTDEVSPTQPVINNVNDVCDIEATFDIFSKSVVEGHQRQLVPLRDVQLAVLTAVESSNGGQGPVPARRVGALEQAGLEQTQGIGYSIIVGPPATDSIGSSSGVPYSLFAPYPSFAPRLFYR